MVVITSAIAAINLNVLIANTAAFLIYLGFNFRPENHFRYSFINLVVHFRFVTVPYQSVVRVDTNMVETKVEGSQT